MSPWAYFLYSILFAIPIIGVALTIIFSFIGSNYNLRNFARSYWCIPLLVLVLSILAVIFLGVWFGPDVWKWVTERIPQ